MCCQAEAAWMRDALAVNDEQIRGLFQLFGGGDADRRFAERKQTRYVGKDGLADGAGCFGNGKIRHFQHDRDGDDFSAVFTESTVQPGDKFWLLLQWSKLDFAGKVALHPCRLCVSQFPVV
jgi:hypothetical protein